MKSTKWSEQWNRMTQCKQKKWMQKENSVIAKQIYSFNEIKFKSLLFVDNLSVCCCLRCTIYFFAFIKWLAFEWCWVNSHTTFAIDKDAEFCVQSGC